MEEASNYYFQKIYFKNEFEFFILILTNILVLLDFNGRHSIRQIMYPKVGRGVCIVSALKKPCQITFILELIARRQASLELL